MRLEGVRTPALLLNLDAVERNLARMAAARVPNRVPKPAGSSVVDETGAERRLAVLVRDMPKVGRRECRLPIDEQTAQIITAQKQRVRERYPDTPAGELRLLPRISRNPAGRRPMVATELARTLHTGWPR